MTLVAEEGKYICCGFPRSWIGNLKWKKLLFIGITLLITFNILYSISLETSSYVDLAVEEISNDTSTSSVSHYERIKTFVSHIKNKLPSLPKFDLSQFNLDKAESYAQMTSKKSGDKLVLDTPTCKIALGNLWPAQFKDNWNWSTDANKVPNCDEEQNLFVYVKPDEVIKVIYPKFQDCNIREVIRKPDAVNNNYYIEVNQINLTTTRFVSVAHMEMFIVACNNKSFNFEANLPWKSQVEEKIAFWSDTVQEADSKNDQNQNNVNAEDESSSQRKDVPVERPINVIWLGIDTTSNIHLHRSFPKTLKVMKEMDFLEFGGYHSIEFMTQPNFLAFLMGSTYGMTDDNPCNATKQDSWEYCPFIWKEFSKRGHVTMFLEDNEGTLNYSEEDGGFLNSPTDYYLQSLFFAHQAYKKDVTGMREDCMSTETVPHFVLRYNERFLQKFNSTPFFTFSWFNYPFHAYDFALPNVDADFEQFYKKLQGDPSLLENTLLILNADHGERYGLYRRNSMEGFLERSLPPLFIRIPERLLQKFPHLRLKENALTNTNRLTTAFDLHHTLLHIVALNDQLMNLNSPNDNPSSKDQPRYHNHNTSEYTHSEFQPVLGDRSSLFSWVPDNRTCETVGIDKKMCVCNTHSSTKHVTNPFDNARMIEHGMNQINSIINGSEFASLCRTWEGTWLPLISADVIHENGSSSIVLLKFDTDPFAEFETQLRITLASSSEELNQIETVTDPVRITSYGNTTWCVPGRTNEEKRFKEFCYCKEDAPVEKAEE